MPEHSSWDPVDLTAILDGNIEPETPTLESYSQALEIGLEEGKGDDAPDDAGQFVEWSPVAAG